MNRLKEIEERLAAINAELRSEDADVEALAKEVDDLQEEKRTLIEKAEQRKATLAKIAGENLAGIEKFGNEERKEYGPECAEYRKAYLKNLMNMELEPEEREAYTHTTTDMGAVLPTTMLNKIWDLVSQKHSIMEDITIYRTGTILEVSKHTEIKQGKAKKVAENAANDDEKNTFVKVTLSGKDFSKTINISYATAKMSIDALEDYLINEISSSIGEALAEDVVATIENGINVSNKIEAASETEVTYKELATLFGKLKRVSNIKVYVNNATLYNQLVAMTDTTGRPIFQPNANDGAKGVLLGGTVKIEDAVKDGKILIGDSSKVIFNMIQDIIIESDKDISKHNHIYSGYARGEGALIDDMSFAELSLKAGE